MKRRKEIIVREVIAPSILRPAAVCVYLGMSRTTLHHLYEKDPTFPRKIHFSPRCVGWRKETIDAWLDRKEKGLC